MNDIGLTANKFDTTALDTESKEIRRRVAERRDNILGDKKTKLFATNIGAGVLWKMYLSEIERLAGSEARQYFNCNMCRETIRKIGHVVAISEEGKLIPLLWVDNDSDEGVLTRAHKTIHDFVSQQEIVSLWVSKKPEVGHELTVGENGEEWDHLAMVLPKHTLAAEHHARTSRMIGDSINRFKALFLGENTGIYRYTAEVYGKAIYLLENNELNGADKFLAAAKFHKRIREHETGGPANKALLWRELMNAPHGWENVNSTMIGQLYGWIHKGNSLGYLKAMWNPKVSGENYQRPTAAPTEQNIKVAEDIVAKMGLVNSLLRRFARLDEVRCFWNPPVPEEPAAPVGVFGSIRPKEAGETKTVEYTLSPKIMTWEKFAETVLPTAKTIKLLPPMVGAYTAFLTAVHADAPPILKWDDPEDRYPVSHYTYINQSQCTQWQLQPNVPVEVTGIVSPPDVDVNVVLLLKGCADINDKQGLGLFPNIVINDLHGVRDVIEAFSNTNQLSGREEATAGGLQIGHGMAPITLQVTTADDTRQYVIDRID